MMRRATERRKKPFYNIQLAVDRAVAGDTIFVMAGTYNYTTRINIPTIGQRNSGMIALHAKGGRAILDFGAMELGDNNQGIRLTGSYWHVYGLDICNAGDNGMLIERNKPSGGDYNSIKGKTEEGQRQRDRELQVLSQQRYRPATEKSGREQPYHQLRLLLQCRPRP